MGTRYLEPNKMAREGMPQRRHAETIGFEAVGADFIAQVGFYADNREEAIEVAERWKRREEAR